MFITERVSQRVAGPVSGSITTYEALATPVTPSPEQTLMQHTLQE